MVKTICYIITGDTRNYFNNKLMGNEGYRQVWKVRGKFNSYGNPKYNITVFNKNNIFRGNYNEVSYNVDITIEKNWLVEKYQSFLIYKKNTLICDYRNGKITSYKAYGWILF